MAVSRRKLGAVLCALGVMAIVAGTAAASKTGTPGVSKKQVLIGGTFPITGVADLYKTIPYAEAAFYAYVNAKGGVHGRSIKLAIRNDEYDPSKTVPEVQKLVEQAHVFAIVGSLGTAPALATWKYLNDNQVPQVLLATGDSYWGDCVKPTAAQKKNECGGSAKPWTMGWQPDYPGEASLYAQWIANHKPTAKIGVLYQDDAYGKQLLNSLRKNLGSHKNQIVDTEPNQVSDSAQTIAADLVKMELKGANTLAIFSTPPVCIYGLVDRTKIGWNPTTILNDVCGNRLFMLDAGQNGASLNGVVSASYVASQTAQPRLAGVKLAKSIIDKYAPSLAQDFAEGDLNLMYGLGTAWTFVHALRNAGANPTRASLMKALRSMNTSKNPFVYPGFSIKTSATRGFPMEQLKLARWAGGNGGDWNTFSKTYSGLH